MAKHRYVSRKIFWPTLAEVALCVAATAAAVHFFGQNFWALLAVWAALLAAFVFSKKLIFKNLHAQNLPDGESDMLETLAREHDTGHPDEADIENALLENALHLREVTVRDCLTPRAEIVAVDHRAELPALRQLFIESGFSRILVATDGDLDRVRGYVHVHQLFSEAKPLARLTLPIAFVSENLGIAELLQKFRHSQTSIAVVRDAAGRTLGLVTMEDALEQLFGDIDDEHD